jgi:histidyl-tRNA synthetase
LADVGGEPLSGVGFAMGDVVIGIILQEQGLLPAFVPSPAPVLVTVFDASLWMDSLALSAELRQAGLRVASWPEPAKLPKQFKYADRMGMKVAVVAGPDEAAAGKVTVKNLALGTQQTVERSRMVGVIREILEA